MIHFVLFNRQGNYQFLRGTTSVLKKVERKVQFDVLSTSVREIKPAQETMEIA